MNILLLAAGRSTRMDPISDKNFLKFCGKTLIEHQVDSLANVKPKKIVIIGGKHNLEALHKLFAKRKGISIVEQKDLDLGMAGALLAGEKTLENEPFLVMSSNDIVSPEAFNLIKKFVQGNKIDSAIVGYQVKSYFPGGYLTVKKGLITSIVEKPGEGKEPSDLINLVLHFHRDPKALFTALRKTSSTRDDRYEVALDSLFKQGMKYHALTYSGFWQAIKYPWHILKAKDYFLSTIKRRISSKASIAKSAVIIGDVIIEDGVKVFDHATIHGPCFIGRDCIIANNALVRGSILGERCVAGYSTEIARSYLADDIWTHTNYIGDSIIDSNVSFGSGTVTGNLRLDEGIISTTIKDEKISTGETKFGLICGSNVRCGINVSFMPAVKIGSGSFIGAGIVVPYHIPDGSFVTGKWEIEIKKNAKTPGNRVEARKKLANTSRK